MTNPDALAERLREHMYELGNLESDSGYTTYYAYMHDGARIAREWTLANDETVLALAKALERTANMKSCWCNLRKEAHKLNDPCYICNARAALKAWKEKLK